MAGIKAIPAEHADETLRREFPDAAWFIIETSQDDSMEDVLQEMKNGLQGAHNLHFIQQGGPRPDGTIIHTGSPTPGVVEEMMSQHRRQQSRETYSDSFAPDRGRNGKRWDAK